jgi:hypothetical protein
VEADVHLGPGGPPNAKKGTVEVCRGGQFLLDKRELLKITYGSRRHISVLFLLSQNGTSHRPHKGQTETLLVGRFLMIRHYSGEHSLPLLLQ